MHRENWEHAAAYSWALGRTARTTDRVACGEQVLTQGPDFHLRNILVAPTLPVLVYQPTKPHSPVPIMSDRNPESSDERTGSVFLCLKFACASDRHLAIAQTSS